ncbi:MAG: phosphoglycerate kinase [Alphaproteobacteria bacterium]|nr:phosphoglycerate kinase [Alphaproteobacteria bacterium]
MKFLSLSDMQLMHKTVLVRVDLNVPTKDGKVTDVTRIESLLPTLQYLLNQQAKIVLISHFGRPEADTNPLKWDQKYSLRFIVPTLEKILNHSVQFVPNCVGSEVGQAIKNAAFPSILLLENLRFHKGEEKNDPFFAKQLAEFTNVYVNDAFSCSHRAHASVVGVTEYLPAAAGLSLECELKHLESCLNKPNHPLVAIVGGSKISTKLELLTNLCQKVDTLIIGGAMANTLLAADGIDVGQSLYEPELFELARTILKTSKAEILLPEDVVVASELTETAKSEVVSIHAITGDKKAFDLGPKTISKIMHVLENAKTVVWNGPVGAFEFAPFAHGTMSIAKALAEFTQKGQCMSVAGGGDSVAALSIAGVKDKLSYVSTAGGAFLEWLEGKPLPGVEALARKYSRTSI